MALADQTRHQKAADVAAATDHHNAHSSRPYPGRTFVGRTQMHANWQAIFAGIPDFRAELMSSVRDGDTHWTEWVWSGTRTGGTPRETRGVTLFSVENDLITAGRLYMQDVDPESVGIDEAVEAIAGQRPSTR